MSVDDESTDIKSEQDAQSRPRSLRVVALLLVCACFLFAGFVTLGTWQLKRLAWKRDLIIRVDQRAHAPPSAIPLRAQWNDVNAQSDEYRRVQVSCIFLHELAIRVQASTILGRGFWLMTPCQIADGSLIWINRGFIGFSSHPNSGAGVDAARANVNSISSSGLESSSNKIAAAPTNVAVVTGLLRMSEPKGTFLRPNQPDQQQWFSRDIHAMNTSNHMNNAAPFFIDAEATKTSAACSTGLCSDRPIGGLTVISFNNNHLVYSITWYILSIMVVVAGYILVRSELRLQRNARRIKKTNQHPKDVHAEQN